MMCNFTHQVDWRSDGPGFCLPSIRVEKSGQSIQSDGVFVGIARRIRLVGVSSFTRGLELTDEQQKMGP